MSAASEPLPFVVRAGAAARERIRSVGLRPEDVRVVAGAAGGPKWIVLGELDRWLFGDWLRARTEPTFLVGSSIATWRFAAAAQGDPREAIDRFERAYLGQRYSAKPDAAQITRVLDGVLAELLGERGTDEILDHPTLRLSVLANRCVGLTGSERPWPQRLGLGLAFVANARRRARLGRHFERAVFHDPRDPPPFRFEEDYPIERVALTSENLRDALAASGSIPLLMRGVRDPAGAKPGVYRDGGLVDYHPSFPLGAAPGIVLYPHYADRLVPGWFDKLLRWRVPDHAAIEDVVMIAPTRAFVAGLPGGRVPDRRDFLRYGPRQDERERAWHRAARESGRIPEAFARIVEDGSIVDHLEPLERGSRRRDANLRRRTG